MTEPDPPSSNQVSEPLSKSARAFVTVASAAMTGAGSVAVFTTDNGTGSAALIAGGLVTGLVAASGRVPVRGSIAGNDYDFGDRVLDRAFDELPPEEREQVARIAVDEAKMTPGLAAAARRKLWFIQATQALERCKPEGSTLELEAEVKGDRYDAMLSTPERAVLITLQHGRQLESSFDVLAVGLGVSMLRNTTRLLITATPQAKGKAHLLWDGQQDDDRLRAALVRALTPPPPPAAVEPAAE